MAKSLRNKLTIFRANFIDKELVKTETVARRRLGEILNPLYKILMTVYPEKREAFLNFIDEMVKDKLNQIENSLESEIIEIISKLLEDEKNKKHFLTSDVANEINIDKNEDEKIKNNGISRIIKRLGFKNFRKGNKRGFFYDENLFKKLGNEYKIGTSHS